MRRIIRRRELVIDDARYDGDQPAAVAHQVITATQFLATPTAAGAAAVLIGPTDEVEQIAPHLSRITLLVVDFPKAGEGRGFSQARLLRQRYGYTGELRARGALKRDQLFFLARCGFDSFDLDPTEDLQASLNALNSFSVAYQDGSDAVVQVRRRGSTDNATSQSSVG